MIYKALHQSVYLEKDKNINTGTRSYLILSTLTNIDQQLNGRLKKTCCLSTHIFWRTSVQNPNETNVKQHYTVTT